MAAIETLYTAGLHVARLVLPLFARGGGKLATGIRGRRDSLARIEEWARTQRDPARPLVWFHAPSVGEGFQARAVMAELRTLRPDVQIAYSFFSPSAERFARAAPADLADFLPIDLPAPVARIFDALDPTAIAFSKTEVWPNITREAERRGVPAVLLSATLPAASSRLRGPARVLLSPAHARLTRVAAIAADDAERFARLGVPADRLQVMGDARFDQVWERANRQQPSSETEALRAAADVTIVAGSTWPADEDRLVGAARAFRDRGSPVRMVLVPHEPHEDHLVRLEGVLRGTGLASERLTGLTGPADPDRVLVVDRVGILGDLYRIADIAYVGGAFGEAGLHSVLEPAAFGAPVVFGPRHANAREAAELVEAGGAISVTDAAGLERAISLWVDDGVARRAAGHSAREFVRSRLGAARRGAEILLDLISRRG